MPVLKGDYDGTNCCEICGTDCFTKVNYLESYFGKFKYLCCIEESLTLRIYHGDGKTCGSCLYKGTASPPSRRCNSYHNMQKIFKDVLL